jgi:hypothetical protein
VEYHALEEDTRKIASRIQVPVIGRSGGCPSLKYPLSSVQLYYHLRQKDINIGWRTGWLGGLTGEECFSLQEVAHCWELEER